MTLTPGTRLGPYDVIAQIGAGGIGEVYRARDTKLGRDVALKVLPDAFASDPDRLARFQREARTLASLNHPNIGSIYGLEEAHGVTSLVMELVEGENLSQRIARGAIPLDEALPIAKQITEALEASHEQGIIHRDLKPSNIKVREDGIVKVLDFGLAKMLESSGVAPSVSQSATTITSPVTTQKGAILGTAAYMSPEQVTGALVDRRADIWAFGVILHEMLSAQQLFPGDSVPQILAKVLEGKPNLDALPATTPPGVRRLIRRCVEKDRRRRLHHIADARLEIEDTLAGDGLEAAATSGPAQQTAGRSPLPWAREPPARVSEEPFSPGNGETWNPSSHLLGSFLRVGSVFVVVMLVPTLFVALGFLTSFTFNRALRIRSTERLLDYLVFGYRAMVGPVATLLVFVAGLALVLAALSILAWLGKIIWPGNPVVRLRRNAVSWTIHWLAGKDARTLGRSFCVVSGAAVLLYVVVAWKLLWVVIQLVAVGPAADVDTSVLSPPERSHVRFVAELGVTTFLSLSAVWLSLFSWLSRRGADRSTVHLFRARSAAMILSILLMVVAPWRLAWHNVREQVFFDGQSAFVLTEDASVVILYVPGALPVEGPGRTLNSRRATKQR